VSKPVERPPEGAVPPFASRLAAALPWLALLVASVAFRLPPLINAPGTHSDAAIVGLQATHILRGEWSWFLLGSGYQTSVDALVAACFFALTGPSAFWLMASTLIGHIALTWLSFSILRRKLSPWLAALLVLPLVLAPDPRPHLRALPAAASLAHAGLPRLLVARSGERRAAPAAASLAHAGLPRLLVARSGERRAASAPRLRARDGGGRAGLLRRPLCAALRAGARAAYAPRRDGRGAFAEGSGSPRRRGARRRVGWPRAVLALDAQRGGQSRANLAHDAGRAAQFRAALEGLPALALEHQGLRGQAHVGLRALGDGGAFSRVPAPRARGCS
jgi:hypothetical protein